MVDIINKMQMMVILFQEKSFVQATVFFLDKKNKNNIQRDFPRV